MKTAFTPKGVSVENGAKRRLGVRLKLHYQLFIMLLVPLAFILVFAYAPMVGAVIAFKNYNFNLGIWDSEWIGFRNFIRFVRYPRFWNLIRNTLMLSVYSLVAGFPMPIILALSLNCVRNRYFKKTVQMLTYLPYFISTVVLCGMLFQFFNPRMQDPFHILWCGRGYGKGWVSLPFCIYPSSPPCRRNSMKPRSSMAQAGSSGFCTLIFPR